MDRRAWPIRASYSRDVEEASLQPLKKSRDRIAVLVFEFGTFSKKSYEQPHDFFADLDEFLARLPMGWRYSVEIPKRRLS